MTGLSLETSAEAFRSNFAESGRLSAAGRERIPGGYSRGTFDFGPHAVYVDSGSGAHIETVDGRRLLDLNNNFTVNVLGHAHPSIVRALEGRIADGFSFGNPGRSEAELARMLIGRIPSVERVQFSCSATESCMSAVRVARAFTGRDKIAKMEGGYHGFSDALHVSAHTGPESPAGDDAHPLPVADSGGIPAGDVENVVVLPQNDRDAAARILAEHRDDLACLMVELQSGSGGLVALDREYVEQLRELTARYGILLVFDETISLRAGIHGGQGVYGVEPDLTVMGKMIGGGLPLGALGGRSEVMAALEDGSVTVSGTHHGHALSVAAGIACLSEMDEAAFRGLNAQAARITAEVNEWSASRGSPFLVYGGGFSHLGYAYLRRPGLAVRSHRDHWRNVDAERTQICSLELANRGFFPVHRGEISLSTPMTDDDIGSFIDALKEIVTELER